MIPKIMSVQPNFKGNVVINKARYAKEIDNACQGWDTISKRAIAKGSVSVIRDLEECTPDKRNYSLKVERPNLQINNEVFFVINDSRGFSYKSAPIYPNVSKGEDGYRIIQNQVIKTQDAAIQDSTKSKEKIIKEREQREDCSDENFFENDDQISIFYALLSSLI